MRGNPKRSNTERDLHQNEGATPLGLERSGSDASRCSLVERSLSEDHAFESDTSAGDGLDIESLAAELLQEQPILGDKISKACDTDDAVGGLVEVLRFMLLVAESGGEAGRLADPLCGQQVVLTPSHRVDLAWHEFILFTRTYIRFCDDHFGRYIHHQPGGESSENRQRFRDTQRRYLQRFGWPCASWWGDDQDSGWCESIE